MNRCHVCNREKEVQFDTCNQCGRISLKFYLFFLDIKSGKVKLNPYVDIDHDIITFYGALCLGLYDNSQENLLDKSNQLFNDYVQSLSLVQYGSK